MNPTPDAASVQFAADRAEVRAVLPFRVELLCRDGSAVITSECATAKMAAEIAEAYRSLHPRQPVRVTGP